MAPGQRWCISGLGQHACHRQHVWERLTAAPGGGKDRACPVCRSNLSISAGSKGAWLVWHCHGGCDPVIVRDALEQIISPECLGSYGSAAWASKRTVESARADSATLAAARRWYAVEKLPAGLNGSLVRMCIQAISEGDGSAPGDPDFLLPRNFADFVALAERAGIERSYRYKLARSYLS